MKCLSLVAALGPLLYVAGAAPSPSEPQLDARSSGAQYTYGLPSTDPFYEAAVPNLASFAPGAIIRSRQLPNNVTSLLAPNIVVNISQTWQILYRTNDIFSAPAVASATIWVPLNGNPNKLLSYQPPWDRPNFDCVSSYELQNGYLFSPAVEQRLPSTLLPLSALNLGWYMVLPDHEGLIAALGSGLTSAYATLDGIRAALNSASFTGISPSARIAMSGYSGGAPPTEFAAELQSVYAPELNIVGAVAGGINPNSIEQLNLAQAPDAQYQNILGQVLGLAAAYPNLTQYLNDSLIPARKAQFYAPLHTCQVTTTVQSLNAFFKNPFVGVHGAVPQSVWIWGTTWGQRGTPVIPLYVNQQIKGPLNPKFPDGYVSNMCSRGVSVTYVRNSKTNHDSESVFGNAGGLYWLSDRLNGIPAPKACTTINVATTTLAASQETLYGAPIYSALASAGNALQKGAIIG